MTGMTGAIYRGPVLFFPHWAQLARSRTFAMLTPSRAVHDIPQWKNSCPASHGIRDHREQQRGMLKIAHLELSKIGNSNLFTYFYTLMLSLKHFWTILFRQKIGKRWERPSLGPRWRVWESQHRQHIRDPELLSFLFRPWHLFRFGGSTLWLFNIAMENGPFIDGLPIKNGDFPWLC